MFKNIKRILLICTFFPLSLLAQDLIIKKNGEVIRCRIDKEDSTNIYFTHRVNSYKVSSFVAKENLTAFEYNTNISKHFELIEHRVQDTIFHVPKRFMLEVNFTPFDGGNIISFNELQTKYWINRNAVLRLGIQLDYNHQKQDEKDFEIDDDLKNSFDKTSFTFGISPGIEYRFLEDAKLSPYIGLALHYEKRNTESEYTSFIRRYDPDYGIYYYEEFTTKVDGGWIISSTNSTNTQYDDKLSYDQFEGSLIFGADYFLMGNLYLGFEIGLGYQINSYKKVKIELDGEDVLDENASFSIPSNSVSDFGLRYNNAIRLGVNF